MNINEEEYLKNRLDDQITWYDNKSAFNQRRFKLLRIIEIISAALIPLCAGLIDKSACFAYITGILGVVIAVCSGLISLNKYQENWIEYRSIAEILKREKYLFLAKSHPYTNEDSYKEFVQKIEGILSKENSAWVNNIKQKGGIEKNEKR